MKKMEFSLNYCEFIFYRTPMALFASVLLFLCPGCESMRGGGELVEHPDLFPRGVVATSSEQDSAETILCQTGEYSLHWRGKWVIYLTRHGNRIWEHKLLEGMRKFCLSDNGDLYVAGESVPFADKGDQYSRGLVLWKYSSDGTMQWKINLGLQETWRTEHGAPLDLVSLFYSPHYEAVFVGTVPTFWGTPEPMKWRGIAADGTGIIGELLPSGSGLRKANDKLLLFEVIAVGGGPFFLGQYYYRTLNDWGATEEGALYSLSMLDGKSLWSLVLPGGNRTDATTELIYSLDKRVRSDGMKTEDLGFSIWDGSSTLRRCFTVNCDDPGAAEATVSEIGSSPR